MLAETIKFGVEYPTTTRKLRPREEGMVVHEWLDTSAYCGSPEQARYLAAGDYNAKRREALADMPNATVTFYELPKDEPFFVL